MRRLLALLTGLLALSSALYAAPSADALPVGEPSVTVVGLDGNAETTTSIVVQLRLVWPEGTEQVTVSNGDGTAQTLTVSDFVNWQLVPLAGQEPAATRTVTVTFTGASLPATTRSDTIVLDSYVPRVPLQRLFANGDGWFLAVRAEDAGTGVRSIAVLGRTGSPLQTTATCGSGPCPVSTLQTYFADRARPRAVRATDAAGNAKVKNVVRRPTTCSPPDGRFPVFKPTDRFYDCVEQGDRCRRTDGHFWNRSAYVRCRKVDGLFRVVVLPSAQ
jgi:hypothetical protein